MTASRTDVERADAIGLLRLFADAPALRERGLFAAEGRFVVERLLAAATCDPVVIAVTPPARFAMAGSLALVAPGVPIVELPPRDLHDLVGYPLDRGCIAIVRRPSSRSLPTLLAAARDPQQTWLVLDDVSNPDNTGSLFRTAAAFGVAGVLLVGGCADPFYRKTVRTSLGNSLSVPFAAVDAPDDAFAALERAGVASVALVTRGGDVLHRWARPEAPLAVWLGHEGTGLGAAATSRCAHRVSIAMPGGIDSLNVAVAAPSPCTTS